MRWGYVVEKLLLTAEEAGELLSIGRTKVYELMAEGRLESVTIGRTRRVPVQALEPFVEALRRGAGTVLQAPVRMEERWSRTPASGGTLMPSDQCAEASRSSAKRSRE
jgi:excisionase family DNA binding protein